MLMSLRTVLPIMLCVLGGCASVVAPPQSNIETFQGPPSSVVENPLDTPLSCVASRLTKAQKRTAFGVVDLPDKSGRVNLNGQGAFGYWNTQGGSDMLSSSVARSGVRLMEMSTEYRSYLDWYLAKGESGLLKDDVARVTHVASINQDVKLPFVPVVKRTVWPVRYVIRGSITGTDFIPGGNVGAGVAGINVDAQQNRILLRVDMRAIKMPLGTEMGGEVVAVSTIQKQIVQDGLSVQATKLIGTTPTLVDLSVGAQRREPQQFSTGALIDLGTANLLAQIFRVEGCGA